MTSPAEHAATAKRLMAQLATEGTIVCQFCNASDVTDDDHRSGCPMLAIHAEIDVLAERANELELTVKLLANGLHASPDEPGDTMHAWAPGHPMGCRACASLDALLPPITVGDNDA
jgi:hypothetical protein